MAKKSFALTLPVLVLIVAAFAVVIYAGPNSNTTTISASIAGCLNSYSISAPSPVSPGVADTVYINSPCGPTVGTLQWWVQDSSGNLFTSGTVSPDPNGNSQVTFNTPSTQASYSFYEWLCARGSSSCALQGLPISQKIASFTVSSGSQLSSITLIFLSNISPTNGQRIPNMPVSISGPVLASGVTNGIGVIQFNNLPTGTYTATYACSSTGSCMKSYGIPPPASDTIQVPICATQYTSGNCLQTTTVTATTCTSTSTVYNLPIATTTVYQGVTCTITTHTSSSTSSYTSHSAGSTSVGPGQDNPFPITLPSSGTLWVNFVATGGGGIKLWILTANQYGQFDQTCPHGIGGIISQCSAPGGDLVGTGITSAGNFSASIPSAGTYYFVFDSSGCNFNCILGQTVTYQYGFSSTGSNCILGCQPWPFQLTDIEVILIVIAGIFVIGIAARR